VNRRGMRAPYQANGSALTPEEERSLQRLIVSRGILAARQLLGISPSTHEKLQHGGKVQPSTLKRVRERLTAASSAPCGDPTTSLTR
jgi:hypothetical protein